MKDGDLPQYINVEFSQYCGPSRIEKYLRQVLIPVL